jgi:hypothetical protein
MSRCEKPFPLSKTPSGELHMLLSRSKRCWTTGDTLVWGKFFKNGEKIHIEGTVKDLKSGTDRAISVDAASQSDITAPVN